LLLETSFGNNFVAIINEAKYYILHNILWKDDQSICIDHTNVVESSTFITYLQYNLTFPRVVHINTPTNINRRSYDISTDINTANCIKITIDQNYDDSVIIIPIASINVG